jgi:hypothetical protein
MYKPDNGHRRRFATGTAMMSYLNKLQKGRYRPWSLPYRPANQRPGKRRLQQS